jgi:hypothetical protein
MLNIQYLLPSQLEGLFESLHLEGQLRFGDVVFGDFSLGLVEHIYLALANAGGNRNPFINALSRLRFACHTK